MSKSNFSFVKWLTKKDVKNILSEVGIELIEDYRNNMGQLIKPISKLNTKEGCELIARCRFNEETIEKNRKSTPRVNTFSSNIAATLATMSVLASFGANSFYSDDIFLLKFEDFFCYEVLSIKNEEDEIEFGKMLTKNYQNYMTKKFGSFYEAKRNAYCKKLKKLDKEENKTVE